MFGRQRKVSEIRARLLVDTQCALYELHQFVITELDPDLHPIEAYITDPNAQRAARLAVEIGAVAERLIAAQPEGN